MNWLSHYDYLDIYDQLTGYLLRTTLSFHGNYPRIDRLIASKLANDYRVLCRVIFGFIA